MQPEFPVALEPLRTELATYFRELPRLLEERFEGKYVVIKGEELHGTWDTFNDARQYGYLRFDHDPFLSQKIDVRFLELFEPYFGTASAGVNGAGPPRTVAEVA